MRNMTIYVTLVLLCTIVFIGQSAEYHRQKDEPSLRDLLGVDTPEQPVPEKQSDPYDKVLEGITVDTPEQPVPEKQKPKFRVAVLVGCDDENTKSFIESHIKRELRSLQDVEIVGIGIAGGYNLSIVAIEMKSSGRKNGTIAVSYVFTKTFDPFSLRDKIKKLAKGNILPLQLDGEVTDLMWLHEDPTHGLRTGITDALDKICKGIVVDFDTKMLEPDRNGK